MRAPAFLLLVAAAGPALADTLPLARGAYVQTATRCDLASNAVLRDYNGEGIGSRNAGLCRGRVLAHIGKRYTLRQNCQQYGGVPGRKLPRLSENVKLRVDSRTAFTDLRTREHYRLCPGVRL